MKYFVIGFLTFIAILGSGASWLDHGGQPRKAWFFCDVLEWCGNVRAR